MRARMWVSVAMTLVVACGLWTAPSVAAKDRPHVLPSGLLWMYHRALLNVQHCFPLAKQVEPTVRAMQHPQHVHPLNRSDGTQGSKERDALIALSDRLQRACVVVEYGGIDPTVDEADKSFYHLAVTLNAWMAQTYSLMSALLRCGYFGDNYNVYDVRCVPPLVAHLKPYLRSYRAAQQAMRSFRAYWHLVY